MNSATARPGLAIVVALCAVLAGCSTASVTTQAGDAPPSAGGPSTAPVAASAEPSASCVVRAGGRCPGPQPVLQALTGALTKGADGRSITGTFGCGGTLTATESADQVRLLYTASAVRAGGMACAMVPLTAVLAAPLGTRAVVDAVSGDPLRVG